MPCRLASLRPRAAGLALLAALSLSGCNQGGDRPDGPTLHYVGSSTIAHFIRDAEPEYGRVRFMIDSAPESAGGEAAIVEGRADLAGFAGTPSSETLALGVEATRIGLDAIAVLVHPDNPVRDLTSDQLRDVFTGVVRNWSDLGGPDLEIRPLIVGAESATRHVFRAAVLAREDYRECQIVRPDAAIVREVARDPAAIAPLSLAFVGRGSELRVVAVDGQLPTADNIAYPVVRPLHILWWPGRQRVAEFMSWIRSDDGQTVLRRRFATANPDRR